ncbi:unnamed protein product [Hymenolepis diminuta]|uniref:Uncharacterized protein n=1 Tax=Hymenolepis diminuta TaxID=6216 RepID=A0A564XYZ0_HYMDI|nr:unnamed protein product [Hymenolepis diminuta]
MTPDEKFASSYERLVCSKQLCMTTNSEDYDMYPSVTYIEWNRKMLRLSQKQTTSPIKSVISIKMWETLAFRKGVPDYMKTFSEQRCKISPITQKYRSHCVSWYNHECVTYRFNPASKPNRSKSLSSVFLDCIDHSLYLIVAGFTAYQIAEEIRQSVLPSGETVVKGTPNAAIHLSVKVLATVSAAKSRKGKASCHREKRSTHVKRSDVKDEHKSNDSEDKRDDEGDQTDAGLPTTADPLSTASMDDTFSALRRSSFAGRHRGHHRLTVGKLSHSSPPSRRPEAMPPSASIYESVIYSHRPWRLVPFNFERRPGMRVNIPDEMIDWKVPYPGYRPFIAIAERIEYPYPGG